MSDAFVTSLRGRIALGDSDRELLSRAGVESEDDAHSVLESSLPALAGESGSEETVRRNDAIESLTPLLSEARRQGRTGSGAKRRPSGGAAPSPECLRELTPQRVKALLEETVPEGYRLNRLAAIDLLDDELLRAWVPRDQGERGTCVAFAVAACLELLLYRDGRGLQSLSPQFLYYLMRRHPWAEFPTGWDEGATKLGQAREILMHYGVCAWRSAPYAGFLATGAPLEGSAPDVKARNEALGRTFTEFSYADFPRSQVRPKYGVARDIYRELDLGRAVAVGVPQFESKIQPGRSTWRTDIARASGIVGDPEPGATPDLADSGHVFCVVGFQPDDDEPAGGWFIIRNSWGLSWAEQAPTRQTPPVVPDDGYGAVSATYIEKFCWEWLSPRLHHRSHSH